MAYQPKIHRKFIATSAIPRCDFAGCSEYATTKGHVFAKNPDGGKSIPTQVNACDNHKKMTSYFQN